MNIKELAERHLMNWGAGTGDGRTEMMVAAIADERERCAKIADGIQRDMHEECDFGAGIAAKAIRAQSHDG